MGLHSISGVGNELKTTESILEQQAANIPDRKSYNVSAIIVLTKSNQEQTYLDGLDVSTSSPSAWQFSNSWGCG